MEKVTGALPCIEGKQKALPQWQTHHDMAQDNHKLLREPTRKETKTRRKPPKTKLVLKGTLSLIKVLVLYVAQPIESWSNHFGKSVDSFRST
ncbi:hypothetical protein BDA96_06G293000 [Sorghum bicolor]|uniref:Uncharacterized protein n=1 Tax=Sorghum bicolor TaxID=4558 RepID=A0A921QWZ4_SORBI|nr:hypothetical protein BDA96_06G293000 [Sorghum bicolor]